jgi:hypothetical protein
VIAFLVVRKAIGDVLVAKRTKFARALEDSCRLMTGTKRTFSIARSYCAILFGAILFFAANSTGNVELERSLAKPGWNKVTVKRNRDHDDSTPQSGSPLRFVENIGQIAEPVRYVSHGTGYELSLTQQDILLALNPTRRLDLSPTHRAAFFRTRHAIREKTKSSFVRVHLANSNPKSKIAGMDSLPGRVDYFLGGDPARWRTNVPAFARVKYANVYPGIDLVFYGNQRQIEYDFIVAPGADPKAIDLRVEGARNLRVNARGDLLVHMSEGDVEFRKPVVYQESHGKRHAIASRYTLSTNHRVSFEIASYDSTKPLIIDPVLVYSTYLGGEGDDSGQAIAVDATGNAVVVGSTLSLQFPTTSGAFSQSPLASNANGLVFVSKFDPTGTEALYSSYIGGTGGDFGFAVALDATGKIYVTGETDSTDFPTTPNALKPGPNSGNTNGTSFVFKIDPTLVGPASLLYSSYLGGTQSTITEFGNGIATDSNGLVYVVGLTASQPGALLANFPVTATTAFQATPGGGLASGTSFLTKLDTTQAGNASLIYSTYLGGNGTNASGPGFGDSAFAVAEDPTGKTYVAGTTTSTDFPTTAGAFQQSAPAAIARGTVFVSRFDTTLAGAASLPYSSYLGGEGADFGDAIALGPNDVAYLTGSTSSLSFPTTPSAFQTTGNASSIAFVSLLDTSLTGSSALKYSTFLGGSQTNTAVGIAADLSGNAYVVGSTHGADFPVTLAALQTSLAPGASGSGFVTKLNPGGQGALDLLYSTYFGGNGANASFDDVNGIALSSSNNALITGDTVSSTGFPITPNPGAFQATLNGPSDAFVAGLTFQPVIAISPLSLSFGTQLIGKPSAPQTVTLTNNGPSAIGFGGAAVTDGSPAAASSDFSTTTTCGASIAPNASCMINVILTTSQAVNETANLAITVTALPNPQIIALSGTGANPGFTLAASPTAVTVTQGASGTFTVTVTPVGGFNQAVSLSCSGAPAMSSCNVSPTSVTPSDGTTPVVATATITTEAPSLLTPASRHISSPPFTLQAAVTLAMLLCLLGWIRMERFRTKVSVLGLFMASLLVFGCGSHHTPTGGTPTGTTKITLTGTSGSLTNSTNIMLTVN